VGLGLRARRKNHLHLAGPAFAAVLHRSAADSRCGQLFLLSLPSLNLPLGQLLLLLLCLLLLLLLCQLLRQSMPPPLLVPAPHGSAAGGSWSAGWCCY